MYYLDAAGAPVITLTPETFTNQAGKAVQLADFSLPTADRLALGIWTLESDPQPDPAQFVVTGASYEKQPVAAGQQPSVMLRHYTTRPLTGDELATLAAAALADAKAAKAAAVDAHLASLLTAGFADATTGKTFRCDNQSIMLWNAVGASASSAITMNVNPAPSFGLFAADGSKVNLAASDAFALLNNRVMPWVDRLIENAHAHEAAIADLTTVAAVQAYDFSAGWQ